MKKLRVDTRKEPKDGEISKLKQRNRRLKKDKDRMTQDIKQLRNQINEMQQYINKHVKDKTIEECIDENKKETKKSCNSCESNDTIVTELPFGHMIKCNNCNLVHIEKRGIL